MAGKILMVLYFFNINNLLAVIVFQSGVPVTVVNDKVTNKLWFGMEPSRDADSILISLHICLCTFFRNVILSFSIN